MQFIVNGIVLATEERIDFLPAAVVAIDAHHFLLTCRVPMAR
jgi:hypothetical protein